MSQLNGRKVTVARVHAPVHMVGVGGITSPITKDSAKQLGALTMERVEGGLIIKIKGNELFVPDGNIQSLQLAPEESLPTAQVK